MYCTLTTFIPNSNLLPDPPSQTLLIQIYNLSLKRGIKSLFCSLRCGLLLKDVNPTRGHSLKKKKKSLPVLVKIKNSSSSTGEVSWLPFPPCLEFCLA